MDFKERGLEWEKRCYNFLMRLEQQQESEENTPPRPVFASPQEKEREVVEVRLDAQTAQKAILLAGKLQHQHSDTMTQSQVETIAEEVGVDPAFVRKALVMMEQEQQAIEKKQALQNNLKEAQHSLKETQNTLVQTTQSAWSNLLNINPKMWWAIAWIMIPLAGVVHDAPFLGRLAEPFVASTPFIYIGMGIYLNMRQKSKSEEEQRQLTTANSPISPANAPVSRQELLNTLFALQKQLENEKQHCAFLSLDVVHSSEMKKNNPSLAVEFSFDQYQNWVEFIVQGEGGQMQIAAGDGAMCIFTDDKSAIRAAQRLLSDLPRFNQEHNHLSTPFQLRCGINAGEVALDPTKPLGKLQSPVIDRAALLQKNAPANALVACNSLSTDALMLLGSQAKAIEVGEVGEESAYQWGA
jgi:class 3 adenylate cyclase